MEGKYYRIEHRASHWPPGQWLPVFGERQTLTPFDGSYGYTSLEDVAYELDRLRLIYLACCTAFRVIEIHYSIQSSVMDENEYHGLGLAGSPR